MYMKVLCNLRGGGQHEECEETLPWAFTEGVPSACTVLGSGSGCGCAASRRQGPLLDSLLPLPCPAGHSSPVCCLYFHISIQCGLHLRSPVTLTVSGAQQPPCRTVQTGSMPLLAGGFGESSEGEMCDEGLGPVNSEKCGR